MREAIGQPFGAFGQEWIGMPKRAMHRCQHPVDEGIGYILVKQVRH